ncbi:hypothetical protein F2Q69_00046057 [Brassica cretica]|uniref:Uncharacterized protein n=1 Tax=Brassica cretica TaxID=69181 RepID=A0A8S9PSB7_BRACR|nr:hypothetical protein F2Q69_00046057 [Brassica cretica]
MDARSLRSDRAWHELGRYVATELGSSSVATFFVKINLFRRFIFRKNVHADFYGLSDIDSVVTDFDPNTYQHPRIDNMMHPSSSPGQWNSNKPTHSVLCEKQLVDRRGLGRNPVDDLTGLDWTGLISTWTEPRLDHVETDTSGWTEPSLASRQFFGLPGRVLNFRTSTDLNPWN